MFENDNRVITMAELEKLLCEFAGDEELTECGARCWNGRWMSTYHIMEFVSNEAYGEREV